MKTKTKTKTKQKLLKFYAFIVLIYFSPNLFAQTSSSPTQSVCIGANEPYLLNSFNNSSTYNWVLSSGGNIVSGNTTNAISIDWDVVPGGPHFLSVTETDINGCIGSQQILEVTINSIDDASFVLTDYCAGSSNSASSVVTSGGTYVFNPSPSGSETIDVLTGEITGGIGGTTYSVEYTTNGICPSQSIETVLVNSVDDASFVLTDYCAGSSNSASSVVTSGGTYVFNPSPSGSEIIDVLTGEITGGIGGTTYSVEYTTNGICPSQSVETVLVNSVDDASFVLTDYCAGSSNSASAVVTSGGSFSFNPLPSGSEIIDVLTGEITGGIGGTTYSVEYTTNGVCSSSLIQNVLIYSIPSTGPIFHN